MAADNWTLCPKCHAQRLVEIVKTCDEENAAYGTIPRKEWEKLVARNKELRRRELKQTLREDYEVGMGPDGQFFVGYEAHCSECKFYFEFKHEECAYKKEGA